MNELRFFASGKLFLFGEYLVLRDSLALTVPLKVGQELHVFDAPNDEISWQCFDENGKRWLSIRFSENLDVVAATNEIQAVLVQKLLLLIKAKNPTLPINRQSFDFHLQFNRQFGFGTSSTLISLLSQWSGVDPYWLLENSFGGSGFDVAAATATSPILYSVKGRHLRNCNLQDKITQKLLFVFLGKKQTSAKEIAQFQNRKVAPVQVKQMNELILSATRCLEIEAWESLMEQSETLLSSILEIPPVKEKLFPDYPFAIKSLGAWGGDFVMATCRHIEEAKQYFLSKGNTIIFTYPEITREG